MLKGNDNVKYLTDKGTIYATESEEFRAIVNKQ